MLKPRLLQAFAELGYDEYKEIEISDIIFSQDVFNQCAKNRCGNFGKNHGCPPRAGDEAERQARVLKYSKAYLLNKIVSIRSRQEMKDSLAEIDRLKRELIDRFAEEDILVLGAGKCTRCENCTALDDKPCRFPGKTEYSMEGCGIDVVRMSMEQQMIYNAGAGKLGFFTLVLYQQ